MLPDHVIRMVYCISVIAGAFMFWGSFYLIRNQFLF